MTKSYLAFPARKTSYLPKFNTRRFRNQSFAMAAYKSDGEGAAEEDKRTQEELLTKIQSAVEKSLETRASKEELVAIREAQKKELDGIPLEALRAMADDKTGVMSILAKQGLEISRLNQSLGDAPKDMSIRSQVERWQKANEVQLRKVMAGDSKDVPSFDLQLRAVASPMLASTVNVGGSPYIGRVEVAPGITDYLRFPNTFWDFLTKGSTNASTYVWVNKSVTEGAAAFIAPGVLKPGISFSLSAENSVAKKIADSAKASTELLQDIDGMTSFIEQELRVQVMLKVNSTLMDSVGTSTVPTGIKQLSVAYTLATVKTTNPNDMDALRAVVAQLRSGKIQGAITIFINPIDSANMDMAKATTSGVYMLPPFVTADGKTVSGAAVIEDPNVPVGIIQAGFMQYYRILIYKDFTVAWGWENDDFTHNLVTAIGEMRLHQFFNDMYTGAFVRDTFANVIAAITAA